MKDQNSKPGYYAGNLTNNVKIVKIRTNGTLLIAGDHDPVLGKLTVKGQRFILDLARLFHNHV